MMHFVDRVSGGRAKLLTIRPEGGECSGYVVSAERPEAISRAASRILAWARDARIPDSEIAALEEAAAGRRRVRASPLRDAVSALNSRSEANQGAFDGLEFSRFPGVVISGERCALSWSLEIAAAGTTFRSGVSRGPAMAHALQDRACAAYRECGRSPTDPMSEAPALSAEANLRNERGFTPPKKKKGLSR